MEKEHSEVILIQNVSNLGAAYSRNEGQRIARGEYLLFVDSDIVLDENATGEMKLVLQDEEVGLVGPMIYYFDDPTKIFFGGAVIDLRKGLTQYANTNVVDRGQFVEPRIMKHGHSMSVFMTKREIASTLKGFDREFFIRYEESDYAMQIEKKGYKIVHVPKAKAWHKVALAPDNVASRFLGGCNDVQSAKVAYYLGMSRIRFMRKHARRRDFVLFCFSYLVFITIIYNIKFLIHRKMRNLLGFNWGTLRGLYRHLLLGQV